MHSGRFSAAKVIHERMRSPQPVGNYTLEDWLRARGYTGMLEHEMRAYRIRWLDALIEEFDPQGETA